MDQQSEIKTILNKLAISYQKNPDDFMDVYLESIFKTNVSPEAFSNACEQVQNTCKTMPSLAHMLDAIRSTATSFAENRSRQDEDNDRKEKAILQKEARRLDNIRKEFKQRWPLKKIKKFVGYWFKGVYGVHTYNQFADEGFKGVTLMAFEKTALFNLDEAGYDHVKAVEIGIDKNQRVKNENKHRYQYHGFTKPKGSHL